MKKMIFLFFLFASSAFAGISEYKADVYFANGILTEIGSAQDNAEKILAPAIIERMGLSYFEKYIGKVHYSYNRTYDSYLVKGGPDLFESLLQKLGLHGLIDKLAEMLDDMKITAHQADLSRQIKAYKNSIKSGHGVLVVAHSQGNLFTEEAYRALGKISKNGWMQEILTPVIRMEHGTVK